MKKYFLLLLISLFFFKSFSQYSNDTSILDYEEKYNYAEYYIADADYENAIVLYEELLQERPTDMDIHFRLGFCYLFTQERYKAVPHLEKVVNNYRNKTGNKGKVPTDAYYYLAKAQYINYDFESSRQTYNELKTLINSKKDKEKIDQQIQFCNNAEEIYLNPVDIIVTKLAAINSEYPDHSPVISADESVIIFTSRREGSTGGLIADDHFYFEDIYIYDKAKGFKTKPVQIDTAINTVEHEASCGLSIDAQELFIYKSTTHDQGDIYYSNFDGKNWSVPEKLNESVNTTGRESHASISADGNSLYFTSNRSEGLGGMDLYVAEKQVDGSWGNVRNLGAPINTELDEEGPYFHPDGKTLYFSSQGHKSMGGFDVFTSTLNADSTWSTPVNLGFPLNTVDNDVFFVPTVSGNRGYYSSQQDGHTSIYIVDIYGEEKNLILVNGHTYDSEIDTTAVPKKDVVFNGDITTVNGRVVKEDKTIDYSDKIYITDRIINSDEILLIDSVCTVPYKTDINVYLVDSKKIDEVHEPIEYNGKYLFILYPEEEYLVYYEADEHMYDLKYIYKEEKGYYNVYYNAEMDTLLRGTIKEVKDNPYVDKTSNLSERQKLELDILSDFMKKHDFLFVNFSTHNWDEEGNQLDVSREQKAVDYLVEKGINSNRIVTNLSPNLIADNTLEYTILDDLTLEDLKDHEIPVANEVNAVFVSNIRFDINKYKTNEYDDNLSVLAEYLIDNPSAKINIFGYTDTQGPEQYNKDLSKKRAGFVSEYLISNGVNEDQVTVDGKGFEVQIAKNKDEKGEFLWDALEYNRRVEFVVTNQGESEMLFVEQIDVPEDYIIENIEVGAYIYSIQFLSSKENKPLNSFEGLNNVKVYKGVDGYYNYYYGEFKNFSLAQKAQDSVKDKYPSSIIFINNF
jgi:outer membrane protein OmpA-like peptidoglycan-associated protein/Tol biopolymer transport system component